MSIRVYVSYAPQDEALCDTVVTHLSVLEREGVIEGLSERHVDPGVERRSALEGALEEARLILLLVSANFLASKACDEQAKRALERHKAGEAHVIPIILRACDWAVTSLRDLDVLPKHGRALMSAGNLDEALANVTVSIRQTIQQRCAAWGAPHIKKLLACMPADRDALILWHAGGRQRAQAPLVAWPPDASRTNELSAHPVHTVKSNFRVDVLSYLHDGTLFTGFGKFDERDIEKAVRLGVVKRIVQCNAQTGMDGRFSEHVATNRYILPGYHDIGIYTISGKCVQRLTCDPHACVISADWSPNGDRLVVGSTNYITIWKDNGELVRREGIYAGAASHGKSVSWQPSETIVYCSGATVSILSPDGQSIKDLSQLSTTVTRVAVAPDLRILVATAIDGEIVLWNNEGTYLARLQGVATNGYWLSSRCLELSPSGDKLAQCACTGSTQFVIIDMISGRMLHISSSLKIAHLAWNPVNPRILAAAGEDGVEFWTITS